MTVKVLVNDPLDASAMETLAKIPHTEIVAKHYEQAELKAVIPNYHVLVVRSATKANKEIIEAGTNLKLIARAGTGLDNVDVKTAQARNITVINTPGANAISVAELTIGLALSLFRFIPRGTAGSKAASSGGKLSGSSASARSPKRSPRGYWRSTVKSSSTSHGPEPRL